MKSSSRISYPVKLGKEGKNTLEKPIKKKKKVKKETQVENLINDINIPGGRWININYEDWSDPTWMKIKNVAGVMVDRSLRGSSVAKTKDDVAIYTEYEDPVSQMIVFDLVPIDSPIFDMDKQPPKNLTQVYNFGPNIPLPFVPYEQSPPSSLLLMGALFTTVIVSTLGVMAQDN